MLFRSVPPEAWHTVSMDFIEGLPMSGKFDTILVVVDKLTKYGHFIPLKHPFTATTVAQLFVDNVYKLHRMPKVLISDRDKVFTSTFWQQLFKLADTTLNLSSSYHPLMHVKCIHELCMLLLHIPTYLQLI